MHVNNLEPLKVRIQQLNEANLNATSTAQATLTDYHKLATKHLSALQELMWDSTMRQSLSSLTSKIKSYCLQNKQSHPAIPLIESLINTYFFAQADVMKNIFKHVCMANNFTDAMPMHFFDLALISKQSLSYSLELQDSWLRSHQILWQEHDALLRSSCKTAQQAIEHIIAQGFRVANLSSFPDLTDELLEELFDRHAGIDHLILNAENLSRLPEGCWRLQTLHLSHQDAKANEKLRSLPTMPWLKELICCDYTSLESLPYLPSLTTLICCNCTKLSSIDAMPELKSLCCSGCSNLQYIAAMPKLAILECNGCRLIKHLPSMPVLEKLWCCGCYLLISIATSPQLNYLNCSDSQKLECIASMPLLANLYCHNCPKLTTLPSMPKLRELQCHQCAKLEIIDVMPQLHSLTCTGCIKLKKLPSMPKVQELHCQYCIALEGFPYMPELCELEYSEELHAQDLDNMPKIKKTMHFSS